MIMFSLLAVVVVGVALPPALAGCPPSFVGLQGSCYKILRSGPTNWDEAREECRKLSGDLAVLSSPEKIELITDFMDRNSGELGNAAVGPHWIGGLKNDVGIWEWVNGARINLKSNVWTPSTPDKNPGPSYVMLRSAGHQGRRYLVNENAHLPGYICEA